MVRQSGLTWTDESLFRKLDGADVRFESGMAAMLAMYAPRVESYAKQNAKWTDRTGNARQGLTATTDIQPGLYAIDLAHSVPYGIWLEVRWSGKYAIINPTIQKMGREVMSGVRTLLRRL